MLNINTMEKLEDEAELVYPFKVKERELIGIYHWLLPLKWLCSIDTVIQCDSRNLRELYAT